MFRRCLIANRGEIAVRVIRACRDLGVSPVAVYSDADRDALHVREADHAVRLGPPPASESYLRIDGIIDAARQTGAEAVHPGYGFLAESAALASACEAAGLVFVGPPVSAIEAMGEKTAARRTMAAAGVPVVPGTMDALADADEACRVAEDVGYPVLLKASAGGGGKGMRLCESESGLRAAFASAGRVAAAAFGNGAVYLEKALIGPRHVEVQILADTKGHVIHLGERDCSIQRRHQKVIEETPCPVLAAETREAMGRAAVEAAQAVGYTGAGTVEFLLDAEGGFHFLEMNTRIQVEHPITELVTGVDLVAWQLRIAAGERLDIAQGDVEARGHAIECRIYAEDPERGWLPSPGRITALTHPSGPGIREDTGVYAGWEVPTHYDPLLSKLCAVGPDRRTALARMRRALSEMRVEGIATSLRWHARVLEDASFIAGDYDTGFVGRLVLPKAEEDAVGADLRLAALALEEAHEGARRGAASSNGAGRFGWRRARVATWRSGGLL